MTPGPALDRHVQVACGRAWAEEAVVGDFRVREKARTELAGQYFHLVADMADVGSWAVENGAKAHGISLRNKSLSQLG